MPIGFADLLKTNAQFVNGLNKGIVDSDDTVGGIRSHIDDWTELHLSTYTTLSGGTAYTFQDDGTTTAPSMFKAYATMFYVADGRPLVQDDQAVDGFIELNGDGECVASGGTKFIAPSGTAEPEFWVLDDTTQVGGVPSGRNKLPRFTITDPGNSQPLTAIPAGYQKLQVLTNAQSGSTGVSASDLTVATADNAQHSVALTGQTNGSNFSGIEISTLTYTQNNGSADVLAAQEISVGTGAAAGTVKAAGSYDLKLKAGAGNAEIKLYQGTDKDVDIIADGTGCVRVTDRLTTIGNNALVLNANNNSANSAKITLGTGSNAELEVIPANVDLTPAGTGRVKFGTGTAAATLTSSGAYDLRLETNSGTNSGHITITDGTNGNLALSPNGTGKIIAGNSSQNIGIYSNGTQHLLLGANSGTNGGLIELEDGANGNVIIAPDGTGDVYVGQANVEARLSSNGSGNLVIGTNKLTGDHGKITITQGTNGNINITPHGTGQVIIDGDLTVSGDTVQQNSSTVTFEDTIININVARTGGALDAVADATADQGFEFTRTQAGGAITKKASFLYDPGKDVEATDHTTTSFEFNTSGFIKFTGIQSNTTGGAADADNLLALKFDVDDTVTQVDVDDEATTTDDDSYTNATSSRSLGAIARCQVVITSATNNGATADPQENQNTNYAPDLVWEDGYVVKHNLGTKSVYVVAIKDPSGTPIPVHVKYEVLNHAAVRVYFGKTADEEVYDVLVMG